MEKNISICGSDCSACYCFEQKMCNGCNECKGRVFHCSEGQECSIYHCCVSVHNYSNCLECKDIPWDIWKKTRDPKFSDAKFEKNIMDRIELLKTVNSKA